MEVSSSKSLPENAYRPLKPGEVYQPIVPADSAIQPLSASFRFSQPSAIGLRQVFPVQTTSTFLAWPPTAILNSSF